MTLLHFVTYAISLSEYSLPHPYPLGSQQALYPCLSIQHLNFILGIEHFIKHRHQAQHLLLFFHFNNLISGTIPRHPDILWHCIRVLALCAHPTSSFFS
jgi:hypothetical protein